ncbi:MAG: cupredoxin domain-containing protein [Burkholderiales bacterium]|nr:cupredoxin domain-containing protein [Burkholderiales bacterium]
MRKLFLNLVAVLTLAGAFAGPVLADGMPTFTLVMRAGRFQPETLVVPANTKFRLLIKNEGPGAEEFESIELRKEKVLAPGVTSFLIFQPLKPGSYKFFGDFHPATAQGRFVAK